MRREAGWIAPKPEYFTHSCGASALCLEKTDFCPLPSAHLLEKSRVTNLTLGTCTCHRGDVLVTLTCGAWDKALVGRRARKVWLCRAGLWLTPSSAGMARGLFLLVPKAAEKGRDLLVKQEQSPCPGDSWHRSLSVPGFVVGPLFFLS